MNAILVAAATTGHVWAQPSTRWDGTDMSGAGFFWFGLGNVVLLVAFLVIVAQRRERPAGPRHEPAGRGGATAPSTAPASSVSPVTTVPALRASDAEREAAAETLCQAIAVGCLDMEEGMARVEAVHRARYRHQLASLLDDVPEEHRRPAPKPARRFYRDLRDFGLLALGAAVVLQALVGVWALWPVAVAAFLPFAFRGRGRRWP